MPMHPAERDPALTLQEDREAIIFADRLGFHDAFVGEHLTDRCENITNSFVFLATLIHETRTIKLATGTANLSHSHPALLAAHAAMFDHLARGRFIFGEELAAILLEDAQRLGDRKSTRLNSSHEWISYAVFCLKKKKSKEMRPFAERLITLARRGDLHARRLVERRLKDKQVTTKLFAELGKRFAARPGGYTRIV